MYARLCAFLPGVLLFACIAAAQSALPPSIELHGKVHPSQHKSYIEAPFTVPAGTHRITVSFHNLGQSQRTVLDLGIADPYRFRGASGGNKQQFTLSETDATPSYLPGAIPPGRWKLLIAVPNIRPGITTAWRAEVWFNRALDDASFTDHPLRDTAGWYRGDLHMHDAHSDGSCPSQTGKSVPCPLFLTVDAAARRSLDFIAISDHNTTSQYNDERELQPYFDKLLLIPGRELTTFNGHANAFGTTQFIDYRVGTPEVPDVNTMFRSARSLGAIVSINHPESPTGEICMGCGWTPAKPVDMNLVTSIEVVNGDGHPATRFWDEQLRRGYRLTAIGGSDNHRAALPLEQPGSIGWPTTVVYAPSLSTAGILDGIRSGRVFIDLTASPNRLLEMQARTGSSTADMGDDLEAQQGAPITVELHIVACEGAVVRVLVDGNPYPDLTAQPVTTVDTKLHVTWRADGRRHYLRAEVRDTAGLPLLLGNAIYIDFGSSTN